MPNFGTETNPMEQFNDNRSPVEAEGDNFKDFVIAALEKKGAHAIMRMIDEGTLNIELEKNKAVEAGKAAEKVAEEDGEEFDPTQHFLNRAEMLANDLIKKQQSL